MDRLGHTTNGNVSLVDIGRLGHTTNGNVPGVDMDRLGHTITGMFQLLTGVVQPASPEWPRDRVTRKSHRS